MEKPLLIIQCAALGYDFLKENQGLNIEGLNFYPLESPFPALTCVAQASFKTASKPEDHGMVFNGTYQRPLMRPSFWEQSSKLVKGQRIWKNFKAKGKTVGMLFWQQSLGEDVDVLLSPWPVHKHGGGLVDITYSKPEGLYEKLCQRLNKKFHLHHYWGPLSGYKSSLWIARATAEIMGMDIAPDLLFTYLPHLDYALQKYGPDHEKSRKSLAQLVFLIKKLLSAAKRHGYEVMVFGDYAIGQAREALYPNRILREKGLLKTRMVGQRLYPDYYESRAFAVTDHEVAHVYLKDKKDLAKTVKALEQPGKGVEVLFGDKLKETGLASNNSGEIVLKAPAGLWFAYPWWKNKKEAPDYATHIDIHNKPGFDPLELFFSFYPPGVPTDPEKIGGTHGRTERPAAWAASFDMPESASLVDLAVNIKNKLDEKDD